MYQVKVGIRKSPPPPPSLTIHPPPFHRLCLASAFIFCLPSSTRHATFVGWLSRHLLSHSSSCSVPLPLSTGDYTTCPATASLPPALQPPVLRCIPPPHQLDCYIVVAQEYYCHHRVRISTHTKSPLVLVVRPLCGRCLLGTTTVAATLVVVIVVVLVVILVVVLVVVLIVVLVVVLLSCCCRCHHCHHCPCLCCCGSCRCCHHRHRRIASLHCRGHPDHIMTRCMCVAVPSEYLHHNKPW